MRIRMRIRIQLITSMRIRMLIRIRYPTFQFDADPDQAYHFDAAPDPAYHFDADPDPHQTVRILPFSLMRIRIHNTGDMVKSDNWFQMVDQAGRATTSTD
jgi:hypothetical protein